MNSFLGQEKDAVLKPAAVESAWDEAFLRVESYLRAHHLESRMLLNEVVTDIIREARATGSGEEPVVVAMRITHKRIGEWLTRAGDPGDWSDVRARQRGRLSLVLGDLPGKWPGCFLSKEPVPAELSSALASGVLKPGPELHLSAMPPAPLAFGFTDPANVHAMKKNGWVALREAAMWIGVVGFFGVAWAASH